jgi:hypothetical protein
MLNYYYLRIAEYLSRNLFACMLIMKRLEALSREIADRINEKIIAEEIS